MNIKPIPTTYRGITFRSKLEAQWAVYFDQCNANWEYEPEGFDLGDGVWYMPDFLLHDVICGANYISDEFRFEPIYKDLFIEVKGVMDEESLKKIEYFIYGDRETRIRNLKQIFNFDKFIKTHTTSMLARGIRYCTPIERSIFVVGKMPLTDELDVDFGILSPKKEWLIKNYCSFNDRLFYNREGIYGYSRDSSNLTTEDLLNRSFPMMGRKGGLVIPNAWFGVGEHEFADIDGTLNALNYARNYRFDHRKK